MAEPNYRVYKLDGETMVSDRGDVALLLEPGSQVVPLEDVQAVEKTTQFVPKGKAVEDSNVFLLVDPMQVDPDDIMKCDPKIGKKIHVIRRRAPWSREDGDCPPLLLVGLNMVQELCGQDMGQFNPDDFDMAMQSIYGKPGG